MRLIPRRIRAALYEGHAEWKWRHDTSILLRLMDKAEEERQASRVPGSSVRVLRVRDGADVTEWFDGASVAEVSAQMEFLRLEQVDPWQT